MSYHIESGESVEAAIRRIAAGQLDCALAATEGSFDSAVHEVRRRCKRLRAVVRMTRASMAEFQQRDDWLKETAALLSRPRDAAVLQATHRRVVTRLGGGFDDADTPASLLLDGRRGASISDADRAALTEARSRLETLRASVRHWCIDTDGFAAIRSGVQQTYARSRRAMRRATVSRNPIDCHRWRKRVKYHAFQMRVLRELWPQAIEAREAAATELGELLGIAHDLANYRAAVDAARDRGGSTRPLGALMRAAAALEKELLARSWPIGQRLFAVTPAIFVAEIGCYWNAWRGA